MLNTMRSAWINAHLFASFFTSPDVWLGECRRLLPHLEPLTAVSEQVRELALAASPDDAALPAEYSRLFWGTDASVSIPLWASACKNKNQPLINEATLEIIRFYNHWGFRPEPHSGNPPDYMGAQFRFGEYLHACALHDVEYGNGDGAEALAARDDFVVLAMADTLYSICERIQRYSVVPLFRVFAECMRETVALIQLSFAVSPAFSPALLETLPAAGIWKRGRAPAIPDAPARVVHTGGFNNCGGRCSIDAHVREDCVLRFAMGTGLGNPRLRPCVRIRGYRETFFGAQRLRYPLLRTGRRGEGKFRRIGWDEAVGRIAAEWIRIRDAYGPASRFVVHGDGVSSMLSPGAMMKRLLHLDGGRLGAYGSYSDGCAEFITPYIYGDPRSGNSPEDLPNSRMIILWGHNPEETLFGVERRHYLGEAKRSGAKIVVIDPRRSDSALAYGAEWIGIRPSTDSALADGMAYVIWTEKLWDKEFMDTFCLGFDEEHLPEGATPGGSYERYLFGKQDGTAKTPEWAASITGVPAGVIIRLAREYATTKPACLLPGWGLQRTGNGEQTVRSLALLPCLTGNVGIPGGGAAGVGWVNGRAANALPQGVNPYPGEIPDFLWSKAVDKPDELGPRDGLKGVERLESGVKMLFSLASNTMVNQHSNVNDSIRILTDESKCEFILSSDLFLTSSARYADIVLPAASGFETDNITTPWAGYGNYLLYNNQVRPPLFESRFEWGWMCELAGKLGLRERFEDGKPEVGDWLRFLYSQVQSLEPELPPFEEFKQNGGYDYKSKRSYIAYAKQRNDFANNPFSTPSGKIEIYSERLRDLGIAEIPPIPRYVPCPEGPEDPLRERYPLQLIGWHTKRRTHTIFDNCASMENLEPQRLWINPADAARRDIQDGDEAEVYNDRGKVRIRVLVTDRIMRGVVAMPQGAWHRPNAVGVDLRGSINVLTSTANPTPAAKSNPQHTNLVEVKMYCKEPVY